MTAFAIDVGVASGDIVVASLQRIRERIVDTAVRAVTDGLAALVVGPLRRRGRARRGWRRSGA